MSRYPDTPRPIFPHPFRSNRPDIEGGPAWAPQSRPLTSFGLGEVDLSYHGKTWAQVMALYNFFERVSGPAGRFTYVDFNGIGPIGGADPGVPWTELFVAKGDGATTSWDSPTFGIHADVLVIEDIAYPTPIVYENGVAKPTAIWTSGSTTPAAGHYLVIPGTGTDGVDTINAGTAPAKPVLITIDATCRRAFRRAKFLAAKNPFSWTAQTNYYQETVTILEVRK